MGGKFLPKAIIETPIIPEKYLKSYKTYINRKIPVTTRYTGTTGFYSSVT